MASKRQREESQIKEHQMLKEEGEDLLKRQKSYNQILSLLEEEEEEAVEDLSSIIITLQQELQQTTTHITVEEEDYRANFSSVNSSPMNKESDEEEESVMRHLLEASDDELGIPNGDDLFVDQGINELGVAFWELEDEAANYYTLFQSQLFM